MYLTSGEMKQVSCRKFSVDLVNGSSAASMHFISISNFPPRYCSIKELEGKICKTKAIKKIKFRKAY